jgi:dTDP-4-dehydrorhamnose 3,5-epimerase
VVGQPIGRDQLVAKQSAVDASGELSRLSIEGVMFRPTRPVVHEDGHLVEVVRADWPIVTAPVVQVHITTTLPGHVRAWGLHQRSTDRLFVVSGLIRFAVFDGRPDSPTRGQLNDLLVSERSPGLLIIPPNSTMAGRTSATPRRRSSTCPTACTITRRPTRSTCRGTARGRRT